MFIQGFIDLVLLALIIENRLHVNKINKKLIKVEKEFNKDGKRIFKFKL